MSALLIAGIVAGSFVADQALGRPVEKIVKGVFDVGSKIPLVGTIFKPLKGAAGLLEVGGRKLSTGIATLKDTAQNATTYSEIEKQKAELVPFKGEISRLIDSLKNVLMKLVETLSTTLNNNAQSVGKEVINAREANEKAAMLKTAAEQTGDKNLEKMAEKAEHAADKANENVEIAVEKANAEMEKAGVAIGGSSKGNDMVGQAIANGNAAKEAAGKAAAITGQTPQQLGQDIAALGRAG